MDRINLTDDDLAANRQGRLNDNQRHAVRLQQLVWIAGTIGLASAVVGVTAVLLLKLRLPTFFSRGELFIIVPVALLWIWLLRQMPQR